MNAKIQTLVERWSAQKREVGKLEWAAWRAMGTPEEMKAIVAHERAIAAFQELTAVLNLLTDTH